MKVLELFYGGQMEHACQKQINWRAEGGRVLETNSCAEEVSEQALQEIKMLENFTNKQGLSRSTLD